jgi:tetratricopeptide (TPR) repeat protein
METRIETCALCGAQIDPETGGCPYCLPSADKAPPIATAARQTTPPPLPPAALGGRLAFDEPASPATRPAVETRKEVASAPTAAPPEAGPSRVPRDPATAARPPKRHAGPIEFEAEECLARGDARRALVLASQALKEQPENLTVRALYERSRKAILRGQRGERLEKRVQEARDLVERGDLAGADRIVTSALKLVPNHAAALELFALIKERRLAAPTAEAEAERDLARIAGAQVAQFLRRARTLHSQGSERAAFLAVRRGLRLVPDDKDLLTLYGALEQSLSRAAAQRAAARRRVQEALAHLERREIERSRDILRAVLRENPDHVPAQSAMRAVRAAYLGREERARIVTPVPRTPPPSKMAASASPQTSSPTPSPRPAAATPVPVRAPTPAAVTPLPGRPLRPPLAARSPQSANLAQEVLLPRTRRRGTPLILIAIGAFLTLGTALFFVLRSHTPRRAAEGALTHRLTQNPTATRGPHPLDGVEPSLRAAIETTLAGYVAALEHGDSEALGAARPDLSVEAREAQLAALRGALNVAVDARVIRVERSGEGQSLVHIQRTDVVVGTSGDSSTPVEETLRFVRRGDVWTIE